MKNKYLYPLIWLILLTPLSAAAHPFGAHTIGFWSGLLHPVSNLYHVITVVLLGYAAGWAFLNTRYYFLVFFVSLILIGSKISLISVDFIDTDNELTPVVMTLSMFAVPSFKIFRPIQVFIFGGIALLHGYTHAPEMMLDTDATTHSLGFVLSSALLFVLGMTLGSCLKKLESNRPSIKFIQSESLSIWH